MGFRMKSGDRMGFPMPPGRFFTPPGNYRREPMHPDNRPMPSMSGHPPRGGKKCSYIDV